MTETKTAKANRDSVLDSITADVASAKAVIAQSKQMKSEIEKELVSIRETQARIAKDNQLVVDKKLKLSNILEQVKAL